MTKSTLERGTFSSVRPDRELRSRGQRATLGTQSGSPREGPAAAPSSWLEHNQPGILSAPHLAPFPPVFFLVAVVLTGHSSP